MLGSISLRNGTKKSKKTQKEGSYSCLVSGLGLGYVSFNILWSRPAYMEMQQIPQGSEANESETRAKWTEHPNHGTHTTVGRDIDKGPKAAELTHASATPALWPLYSSLTREIYSPKADRCCWYKTQRSVLKPVQVFNLNNTCCLYIDARLTDMNLGS